jgi:hypothetical protein
VDTSPVPRITLPSGGTVVLRDPEDLTGDDHRRVVAAIRGVTANGVESGRELAAVMDLVYGTACMLVESWDIPYEPGRPRQPATGPWPLPCDDPAILGKLKIADYRTLIDKVGPAAAVLFPPEDTPDDAGVPGTPTPPAGA